MLLKEGNSVPRTTCFNQDCTSKKFTHFHCDFEISVFIDIDGIKLNISNNIPAKGNIFAANYCC